MATQTSREEIKLRNYIDIRRQECPPNDGRFTWNGIPWRIVSSDRNSDDHLLIFGSRGPWPDPDCISNVVVVEDDVFCCCGDGNLWRLRMSTKKWSRLRIADASSSLRTSSVHDSLRLRSEGYLELSQFLPNRDNCTSIVVTTYLLKPDSEADEEITKKRCVVDMEDEEAKSSENGNTRYSRCCEICSSENPLRRAFFTKCGHIICLACATQLADEWGKQDCPFCRRKSTRFMTLVEDVDCTEDSCLGSILNFLQEKYHSVIHSFWLLISKETEEKKNEKADRMRAEDVKSESLGLRYSRLCSHCKVANPKRRAAFVACGHTMCLPCTERLSDANSMLQCTSCRKRTAFTELFEDGADDSTEKTPGKISRAAYRKAKQGYTKKRELSKLIWQIPLILGLIAFIILLILLLPPIPNRPDQPKRPETTKLKKPEAPKPDDLTKMTFDNFLDRLISKEHATLRTEFDTAKDALYFLEWSSPRLFNVAAKFEYRLNAKIHSLSYKSREFARIISKDAFKYYTILLAGGRPDIGEIQATVRKGAMKFKNLSDKEKSELKMHFPSIARNVENGNFRKFCDELFGNRMFVKKVLRL